MELFSPYITTAPLFLFLFVLLISTAHQSFSARTLPIAPPPSQGNHHHDDASRQPSISFLMRSVLIPIGSSTTTSNLPTASNGATLLPFAKPINTGFFPAVSWPNQLQNTPQSQNRINYGLLSRATLEELELGTVNPFEEDLFDHPLTGQQDEGSATGSWVGGPWRPVTGRAKGVYVASSEDGSSYMMAMTAHLQGQEEGDLDHSLRFFGVHKMDGVEECHLAVIGGTGKFENANGYAAIESVVKSVHGADDLPEKMLLFSVYLS